MTVTTDELDVADNPASPRRLVHRPTGLADALRTAMLAAGFALAVLVGSDGSPWWRLARVVVVAACTAALLFADRRLSPRGQGRLAVLAGLPAFAVAVGFTPHLAKGGPLATRAATVVLALAGLVLTIGGAVLATRERGRGRRLATAAFLLVAIALVTFVIGPAVAATNVPRPAIGATPSDVGLDYEAVSLQTADGVTLAAWYVPSSNRAAIVLRHGAGSTRSDVLDQAAVLARAGFGILMLDARGHGGSGGRAMDFGWYGDADMAAATGYLTARPDVDPARIGAVGLSMGGEEAIGASGSNAELRAVVAEGATARTAADEAWLSDEFGLRGWAQEQLEQVQDRVTDLLTSASPPSSLRAAVETSRRTRYLLITAGKVANEGHAAAFVAAGAPDRVETWTVEGAAHTGGLRTAGEEWTDRVTTFLTNTLLDTS